MVTITPSGSQRTEEIPEVQVKDRIAAGKLLNDIDSGLRLLGDVTAHPLDSDSRTQSLGTLTRTDLLDRERQRRAARSRD